MITDLNFCNYGWQKRVFLDKIDKNHTRESCISFLSGWSRRSSAKQLEKGVGICYKLPLDMAQTICNLALKSTSQFEDYCMLKPYARLYSGVQLTDVCAYCWRGPIIKYCAQCGSGYCGDHIHDAIRFWCNSCNRKVCCYCYSDRIRTCSCGKYNCTKCPVKRCSWCNDGLCEKCYGICSACEKPVCPSCRSDCQDCGALECECCVTNRVLATDICMGTTQLCAKCFITSRGITIKQPCRKRGKYL
jgi:hypothetical protein